LNTSGYCRPPVRGRGPPWAEVIFPLIKGTVGHLLAGVGNTAQVTCVKTQKIEVYIHIRGALNPDECCKCGMTIVNLVVKEGNIRP